MKKSSTIKVPKRSWGGHEKGSKFLSNKKKANAMMLKIKKNKNKKPNIGGTVDHFAKSIPRSGNV
jgi:chorismate synthase